MVESVKQEGGISLLLMLKNGLAGAAFFMLSDQPLLLWRCIQRQSRRKGIYPVAFAGAGLMLLFSTGYSLSAESGGHCWVSGIHLGCAAADPISMETSSHVMISSLSCCG